MSSSESISREGSISSGTPRWNSTNTVTALPHTAPALPLPPQAPEGSCQLLTQGEWSRWQLCPSSSSISQRRHKTLTRNNHSKRQQRPHTTNPRVQRPEQPQALWSGRDRAQARPPRPVCCPCPTPHQGAAAYRGPSKMWKYCPVLGLLIAKLFGRKRRV